MQFLRLVVAAGFRTRGLGHRRKCASPLGKPSGLYFIFGNRTLVFEVLVVPASSSFLCLHPRSAFIHGVGSGGLRWLNRSEIINTALSYIN